MSIWEIHPSLVHFPIALLLAGVLLDWFAAWKKREAYTRIAAGLLLWGVATGWVSALAGIVAWLTAPHTDSAHALMWWHPSLAAASMIAFTVLAVARWKRRALFATPAVEGLGAVAALLILAAGYLGGNLVYHRGTGVHAARDAAPERFHSELERDEPRLAD